MSDEKLLSGVEILQASKAISEALNAEIKSMVEGGFAVTRVDIDRILESVVAAEGYAITVRTLTHEEFSVAR